MTRSEALLKLLALEPETRSRLIAVTGWQAEETEAVLDGLLKEGKVTYRNGAHGTSGERRYYPTPGMAGLLPMASGASRKRVRNHSGGLVRKDDALASAWARPASEAGSGEETQ